MINPLSLSHNYSLGDILFIKCWGLKSMRPDYPMQIHIYFRRLFQKIWTIISPYD